MEKVFYYRAVLRVGFNVVDNRCGVDENGMANLF
jgi:hypothetical protein